ncbi:uncharacterized protein DUF4167 [Hoeflea marina]|uniref:Uncharacterized protein DUF4167 n=1 Tax=Hoeflea marina TaxID=274592 RepID=A0A317PFB4_9HYPH|nr:DUF4167 domain-containing protein [Hoeflea marina]PWV98026.1 uncharacterized protein DUF4167 [Hoeflea marina]
MRPGQQNKRGRGRSGSAGGSGNNNSSSNNSNRKGQNPLSRSYDSSGPDVKIRGTAQHVAEKYMNLARDAQSSGDRVMAENYLQHAEHYNRIIFAAQAQLQERFQRDDRDQQRDSNDGSYQSGDGDNDDNGNDDDDMDSGQSTNQSYDDQRFNGQSDRQTDRQNNGNVQQDRSGSSQDGRQSDRQPERQSDRPERTERAERSERAERQPERAPRAARERPAALQKDVAAKPVFDSNSPQPVIDGVPAEVAIEQDNPGTAGAARAPVRRRGRPRRVRTDEGDQGGSADTAPATEVAPAD